jgi:ABC-type multidrug transport system fused ATPase/permease subunit
MTILNYLIIIAGIYLLGRLLAAGELYLENLIDSNIMKFIRNDMFREIIKKQKKRYSEIEIGKLVSCFTILPHQYQDLIYRFLKESLPKLCAIFILSIYFFYVDYRIGLSIVGFFIYYILVLYWKIPDCQKLLIDKYKHQHQLNEQLSDRMTNIFSILVNGQGNNEYKFNDVSQEIQRQKSLKADYQVWRLDTILSMSQVLFFVFIMGLYFYLISQGTSTQRLTLATSIFIFIYIIAYLDYSKWYIVNFFNIIGIIKSFENELIVDEHIVSSGSQKEGINQGQIVFNNVHFSYKNKIVLKNLNLELLPGKINTIIGKSGSGKSTLVKLLLGILPANKGVIKFDNISIRDFDHEYLHSKIAMVSQDVKLFSGSLYDNISYGNEKISHQLMDSTVSKLNLQSTVFKNLPNGLHSNVGVQGSNLSGGQRQITLILRAYLQHKPIFILDEPTTALDPKTKKIILKLIKDISKDKTTIIVTHDLETKNISDNIFELKNQ